MERLRPALHGLSEDRVRISRFAAQALLLLLLCAAAEAGVFAPIERAFLETRFAFSSVEPTGDTVVVEIDSRSMDAVAVWPWPRGYYAIMIYRLREAGARNIAFTIGFANRTTMEADGQLAMAIEHAKGKVILPAYGQRALDGTKHGEFIGDRPIPELAAHAKLAGADYTVAAHSMAISVPSVQRTGDGPVLALGALLAGRYGHELDEIRVDFSITPAKIPSLSFVDVYNGTFDPQMVRGRDVILGGSSRPFGEAITVPIHGSIPSVYFHALVAETIKLGRTIEIVRGGWVLAAVALPYLLFLPFLVRRTWQQQAAVSGTVVVLLFVVSLGLFQFTALNLEVMASVAFLCGSFIIESFMQQERLAATVVSVQIDGAYRQALMESVVSESFDGILIADEGGTIRLANPTAGELVGLPVEHLVGMPLSRLSKLLRPPDDPTAELFIDFDLPERVPVSRRIRAMTGGILELEVVASHIRVVDASAKGVPMASRHAEIYAFRDITVRKRAEQAEARALAEVQRASRAKSEFIANMSHELRTPLNAIIGFSELIKAEIYGPLGSPRYSEYVGDIFRSGQMLLSIVNDLLDVSQIEAGSFPCVPCACAPEEIMESLRPIIRTLTAGKDRRVEIDMAEDLPDVLADPRLAKQILINLLANAVKFTKDGGHIRLFASAEPGRVVFGVADDGEGIPSDALTRVTEAFYQVDGSNARHHEGVGLGLFIVARYVTLMGGRLAIDSVEGEGTEVRVSLPSVGAGAAAGAA